MPAEVSGFRDQALRLLHNGFACCPGLMIDLQLGGPDEIANMSPLDLSGNRSLGAQIGAQLRGVPVGTCVVGVEIC